MNLLLGLFKLIFGLGLTVLALFPLGVGFLGREAVDFASKQQSNRPNYTDENPAPYQTPEPTLTEQGPQPTIQPFPYRNTRPAADQVPSFRATSRPLFDTVVSVTTSTIRLPDPVINAPQGAYIRYIVERGCVDLIGQGRQTARTICDSGVYNVNETVQPFFSVVSTGSIPINMHIILCGRAPSRKLAPTAQCE